MQGFWAGKADKGFITMTSRKNEADSRLVFLFHGSNSALNGRRVGYLVLYELRQSDRLVAHLL